MIREFFQKHQIRKGLFALLVSLSVVFLWRGTWGIIDLYLLPIKRELSLWISLIIGTLMLFFAYYLNKKMK